MSVMEVRVIRRVLGGAAASRRHANTRTRRDQIIARRLQTTFEQDMEIAGVSGLHAYVQNSVVTLHGSVRTDLDRELILSIARRIPAAEHVVEPLTTIGNAAP